MQNLRIHFTLSLLSTLVLISVMACGVAEQEPQGEEPPKAPYQEGYLRVNDRMERVTPFIGHSPSMDLYVQCQLAVDAAKKAGGGERPLCYDRERRERFDIVRIEHAEGARSSHRIKALSHDAEGAHFLVESTGSLYQLLDLSYAVRRDGEYRKAEIRVISGSEQGHEKLWRVLKKSYPSLEKMVVISKPNDGRAGPHPETTRPQEAP